MFYGKESNIDISKKFLESRLSNKDSKVFICEVNNILTGFVQLYPLFSSTRVSKYWLLNDLFVDSEYRGKGYSKLLNRAREEALARMINQAEEKGANAILAFRFQTSAIAPGASEVIAFGTAVKLKD